MPYELLFMEEVARELRVAISTVRHWANTGRLPSVRPGRRRMVRRADLDAFVANAHRRAIDTGARGLTTRGGDPGRLTPTADPSVDGGLISAAEENDARSEGSVDRPGFAGGEARSAEGAQPTGSCRGAPRSGETARIRGLEKGKGKQ